MPQDRPFPFSFLSLHLLRHCHHYSFSYASFSSCHQMLTLFLCAFYVCVSCGTSLPEIYKILQFYHLFENKTTCKQNRQYNACGTIPFLICFIRLRLCIKVDESTFSFSLSFAFFFFFRAAEGISKSVSVSARLELNATSLLNDDAPAISRNNYVYAHTGKFYN